MDDRCEAEGKTARCHIGLSYVRAIVEAGGLPIPIPPLQDMDLLRSLIPQLDGMVFSGGADYPPELYGAERGPETRVVSPTRLQADLALGRLLFDESDMPVLGICLGHQLISLAHGGKLIPHLPEAGRHVKAPAGRDREHPVRLVPGSRLHRIFEEESILVNSAHHQGVDPHHAGSGLEVTARDGDGMVEAVELSDARRFVLGVQWHPERIHNPDHRRRIFHAFLGACSG